MLLRDGRYDEALEFYRKVIELDANLLYARWGLALAYEQKGRFSEAVAELQEAARRSDGTPFVTGALGRAYGVAGAKDEAETALIELRQQSKQRYVPPFDLALIYLGLGDTERSIEWLDKSCEDRSFLLAYFIGVAPIVAPVRSDPRYEEFRKRMHLAQ
jgi:tetratricopeptide (TPR) repeat protein